MAGYQVRCSQPCSRFGSDRCSISSGPEPQGTNLDKSFCQWHDDWQAEVDQFLADCADCPGEPEAEAVSA